MLCFKEKNFSIRVHDIKDVTFYKLKNVFLFPYLFNKFNCLLNVYFLNSEMFTICLIEFTHKRVKILNVNPIFESIINTNVELFVNLDNG